MSLEGLTMVKAVDQFYLMMCSVMVQRHHYLIVPQMDSLFIIVDITKMQESDANVRMLKNYIYINMTHLYI